VRARPGCGRASSASDGRHALTRTLTGVRSYTGYATAMATRDWSGRHHRAPFRGCRGRRL